jgi:S1-C subfamily serine protease
MKHSANPNHLAMFATSLGFSIRGEGTVDDVWWNSLAFKAGITPDMVLQAVNDQKYSDDKLREAILAAEKSGDPIKLLFKHGDQFRTISMDYRGGLRYPHLQRVDGSEDRLGAVLAPVQ